MSASTTMTVTIARPVEDVFAVLSDVTKRADLVEQYDRGDPFNPGAVAEGLPPTGRDQGLRGTDDGTRPR